MKKLFIILVTLLFIGCSETDKKITSFEEMGKKTLDIIRTIESTTYEDFKEHFFSKDQLLNFIDKKLITTEQIEDFKRMTFTDSHSINEIFINSMNELYLEVYYNYLIDNSKKLQFKESQFKEFIVKKTKKIELLNEFGFKNVYVGKLVTYNVSNSKEEEYTFVFFLNDKYYHLISILDVPTLQYKYINNNPIEDLEKLKVK
tara:strand:- start:805 stop:1410 length:606 start_codon:yes stop_codon:yes gene_type:complete